MPLHKKQRRNYHELYHTPSFNSLVIMKIQISLSAFGTCNVLLCLSCRWAHLFHLPSYFAFLHLASTALTFRSTFALHWWFNEVFIQQPLHQQFYHPCAVLAGCWSHLPPVPSLVSRWAWSHYAPFSLLDSQLLFHAVKCIACVSLSRLQPNFKI